MHPLRPSLLEVLMLRRIENRARSDYALQLIWLMGLELFTLAGGRDYPIPSPQEAFPIQSRDTASAADICQRILRLLQEERSDA